MARARDEGHRFDGQAEKIEVSEVLAPDSAAPDAVSVPRAPADNTRQAARAARVRAARRSRTTSR